MNFEKRQIKYNRVKRNGAIDYIVIHDTGNVAKGANAEAHFRYFNGGNRNASADFFVDSEKVLQVNDYKTYNTWHVGDGKGKYGVTNSNSIGIEICVNSDGNFEEAIKKAAELTRFLMKELGVPKERVVRHYDASRKNCPQFMRANDWEKWKRFLKLLEEENVMKECKFTDISGHYAEKHIKELFEMGVVNGVSDNKFNPDANLTRGQAAIMVRNAVRYITGK